MVKEGKQPPISEEEARLIRETSGRGGFYT
jgi:hypothetical protein